ADEEAAQAADALGARAFTLGSSIWFGRGEYRPEVSAGRRLLAHEVAHTVQQRGAGPSLQRELVIGSPGDPAEAAADGAADAVMRGEPASLGRAAPALRRECTVSRVDRLDQRRVDCPDGSYRVTQSEAKTRPKTQLSAKLKPLNREEIGFTFR